jgi:PAS domain S-box-containing protein
MKNSQRDMAVNAGFVLALAILVVIAYLFYKNATAMTEFAQMEERSYAVILELEGLLSDIKDVENGENGFIITGEEKYLIQYRASVGQIDLHLATLEDLTRNHQPQQTVIHRLKPLIRERLAETEATIDVRKKGGLRAASHWESTKGHKPLMDRILRQTAEAREAVMQHLNKRKSMKESSTRKTFLVFFVGNILSFALLIYSFIILRRDVAERKLAEKALRLSEERYRALYLDNPTMIVTIDAGLTMLSVNPICACQLGYTIAELEGQSLLRLFREDDHPAVTEQLRVCIQNPNKVYRWQIRKIRKDGELLWVQQTAQAVYDLSGALNVLLVCQDVTDQKRMEEELRESEERFRATFNQVAVGIGHIAPDGNWLRINQKYCEIVGYTEAEIDALTIQEEITHPDDRETSRKHFQLLLEGKLGNYSLEKRYIRKDGSTVWVNLTASMVTDADGNPRFAVGVAEDITKRKEAEEALRKSEEFLRLAIESADIGTFDFHPSTGELIWSEHTKRHFGLQPDARVDFSIFLAGLHPDDRERVERTLENLLALESGGQYSNEYRTIGIQDGKERWIAARGRVYYDEKGQAVRLTGTTLDITERKRTEEALRLAKSFTDTVINSMPGIFYVCDDQGLMVRWNKRFEKFFGVTPVEMAAMHIHDNLAEENQGLMASKLREVLIEHHYADAELLLIDRHGRKIPHYCTGSPITVDDRTYLVGLGIDISEFKRAQEEIVRLNADLELRAAELQNANREMEAFNYTVAHDLRKPLTVINSYCQLIKELCGDKLDEQCLDYLQETYNGTLRMSRLIDTLLNFARLTDIELRREKVDLSTMAQAVAAELIMNEPERRVTFRIVEGLTVNGDPHLLRLVLDNLFGNAWKYTGRREEAVIEFAAREIDGTQAYFVRDNGRGFDMADADLLFIPFKRLPGAEEWRGFGVGLGTVERIIRRHGGKVWAEGAPDKGATFYFIL